MGRRIPLRVNYRISKMHDLPKNTWKIGWLATVNWWRSISPNWSGSIGGYKTWHSSPTFKKFAAYYYNQAATWNKEVAINYKFQAFEKGTAVFDVERGQLADIAPYFWQTDTSISKNSWGYIHGQDYKSAEAILCDLIDIVSKNGALLFNVALVVTERSLNLNRQFWRRSENGFR